MESTSNQKLVANSNIAPKRSEAAEAAAELSLTPIIG